MSQQKKNKTSKCADSKRQRQSAKSKLKIKENVKPDYIPQIFSYFNLIANKKPGNIFTMKSIGNDFLFLN